ncbi:MAG: hypothetical protein K2W82_11700 [Candidatus Obscuribacterales bacterium]|nr:hypothetical protein [Candidatus Obscuribacterales bacterium]
MSILKDFFVASDSDIQMIERFNRQDAVTIDLVMLCTLEGILTGMDWEIIFDKEYINPAREDSPEGPWIYAVSNTLVKILTALPPNNFTEYANQWQETDDWLLQPDSCLEQINNVLSELVSLCQQAQGQNKKLFLWTAV